MAECPSLPETSIPLPTPSEYDPSDITNKKGINPDVAVMKMKYPFNYTRKRIYINTIIDAEDQGKKFIGKEVTICGWSRTKRLQEADTLAFIALNDGSCMGNIQIVAKKGECEGFEEASKCGVGSSLRVEGLVVESPAKGQAIEVKASKIKVLGLADPAAYPLAKKKHSLEFLRDIAHLRPRTNTIGAVMRVRNACAFATHLFFNERGFKYIHTPIITSADCEGAGEMFTVTTLMSDVANRGVPLTKEGGVDYNRDFFKRHAKLTVSGQLNVEPFACALGDVYTFGPTFRAENSHTARHLSEFWMIEPEMAFADIYDDMDVAEDYVKFCTAYVLEHCSEDLDFFEKMFEKGLKDRLKNCLESPFARITYTEAIEIISKPENLELGKFEVKPYWGMDLGSEHERFLTEKIYKKPVIVTGYPKEIKAFYMKLNPDGKTVAAMDILFPTIGELIGGSQREENLEVLEQRMDELGMDKKGLQWYLDLRRYGTCVHSGFGLGFERLVMYVTGIENIRDVIPYPRWPKNADY